MRENGVGVTHCKQKKNCIPLTLIKKNQNLGKKKNKYFGGGKVYTSL
jgi:hypothetical protein